MTEQKSALKDPKALAEFCIKTLDAKSANQLQLFFVAEETIVADYYIVCCGRSTTHVKALADELQYALSQEGVELLHIDGRDTGTWILLDFGTVLVHVFTSEEHDFYRIEKLIKEDARVDISNLLLSEDNK